MHQTKVNVPALTIGIDLGDLESAYCATNADGEVVSEGCVPMTPEGIECFRSLRPSRIVFEACGQSHWVARSLRIQGHEVFVANPRKLRMISENSRKNDRNDARLLARIGRVDPKLLSPVKERSEESVGVRTLLHSREQLVRLRTRFVSFVRTQVKLFGHRVPSCSANCFHKRAALHIPESLRPPLAPILRMLEKLDVELRDLDSQVKYHCDTTYPQTAVFRQIRGVGPLVALAYVATIEDPRRFASSRTVAPYLGLVPRMRQSGAADPKLRISKEGDRLMRSLLVAAATHIMRKSSPDSALKRMGKRIARSETPRDRGRARIAVARKLSVVLHRLWLTGEVYEPLRHAA
jgi:transposase